MEVTDSEKAKAALTVVGATFLAECGVLLLQWGMSTVGFFSPTWLAAQSFLWLATTCAAAWGAFLLSRALKQTELLFVLLGLCGLLICFELFWAVLNIARLDEGPSAWHVPVAVSALGIGVGIAMDVVFLVIIGKLGRTTAFAAGIGAFVAVRGLITLGFMFNGSPELHRAAWIWPVRLLLSLIVSGGMGALALNARGALAPSGAAQATPASPVIEPEPGGGRLIITGLVLLGLGVGGTALSYSVASSGSGGGRYVIATGAIATGLVQLIRGLGKLGR